MQQPFIHLPVCCLYLGPLWCSCCMLFHVEGQRSLDARAADSRHWPGIHPLPGQAACAIYNSIRSVRFWIHFCSSPASRMPFLLAQLQFWCACISSLRLMVSVSEAEARHLSRVGTTGWSNSVHLRFPDIMSIQHCWTATSESLEARLFDPRDIPFQEIAFSSVSLALRWGVFEVRQRIDRQKGVYCPKGHAWGCDTECPQECKPMWMPGALPAKAILVMLCFSLRRYYLEDVAAKRWRVHHGVIEKRLGSAPNDPNTFQVGGFMTRDE